MCPLVILNFAVTLGTTSGREDIDHDALWLALLNEVRQQGAKAALVDLNVNSWPRGKVHNRRRLRALME